MSGYSGTPLHQKLGLKAGQRVDVVRAPDDLASVLGPLPDGIQIASAGELDFALLFSRSEADLRTDYPPLVPRLTAAGMLWVAWPKKASRYPTDLTEDVVRAVGLENGLVDVKVAAIDDFWSGLKFVRRKKDRS